MKSLAFRLLFAGITICVFMTPANAVGQESDPPLVIFESDLALPAIPPGAGPETPVCIDQTTGLLVVGCDGVEGPKGEPGNLALAGKSCPNGEFLSGFDENGNIICAAAVAQCGNGLIELGEVCDDGNNVDGDGCSFNCQSSEVCLDGTVNWVTGEECDDGNSSNNDACLNTCQLAQCGDEFIRIGLEECDDGNLNDTDACLSNCTLASCGDGFTQSGVEECDDGNFDETDTCLNNCKDATCGDGILQTVTGEECDDGNLSNEDSCDDTCNLIVYSIDFCALQFPVVVSDTQGTVIDVFGRLYIAGLTDLSLFNDLSTQVVGYVGYGPNGSDPSIAGWHWTVGVPNTAYVAGDEPNNDEYVALLTIPSPGDYDFAFRFSGDGGSTFTYCDSQPAGSSDGYRPADGGQMTALP